ncbi:3-phosphoglycerate dehydrogenase [Capsulimonas corticalis]|uniref:3-phosphoglycerate dehydrogenase n=1 Tax=Capsulimonas corticalis TaxID=2219043 RepID=A0A402D288_9BACT|nr:D-2-hydroxyacid dehydrogenase [Capsulimonas corticalis]BDI30150.1 3-phosphoglycerate dehydrogenase [Capsulimonas corticalis]
MSEISTLLIGSKDTNLISRAQSLSPALKIVSARQIEEAPNLLPAIDAAYGWLSRDQIAQAKNLRWLQLASAGVNGLITPEIRARDLILTNAKGIHAEPITEHMFGMLLTITRRLGAAWDRQKTGVWSGDGLGDRVTLLAGKTLGVLGVGAIGGQSAKVGKAFGMRVAGLRRSGEPHEYVDHMYTIDQKHEFLAACDVIMNTLPQTEKTRGFLGPEEFETMKHGAILINTGRGATIETDAMLAALNSGKLGAALLDVTDPEPLPEGHPLWTTPNVFITPHYSGAHPEYDERADRIFLENLRRYLAGEALINVVDKEEGY